MNSENSIANFIKKIWNRIPNNIKVCFYSAIICGLFAHIYVMTNHLYNYDEIGWTPAGYGGGIQEGRWGLEFSAWIVKKLFGNVYTIPVINGMIAIITYAIVACLVVDLFKIKDELYAGLTGALFLTFPSLTTRMFFMYCTHFYAIGMLFAVLGTWIIFRGKKSIVNVIIAIGFVTISMGIYQSNFVTAVCMCVVYLLMKFIEEEYELKASIIKCVKCVVFLALDMVMYFVVQRSLQVITSREMIITGAERYDTIGELSLSQLMTAIKTCYMTFFRLGISDVLGLNPRRFIKCTYLICICVIVYMLYRIWISEKKAYTKILVTLIIAILPIAINLIVVMTMSFGMLYAIMTYEVVYMFIVAIVCLESLDGNSVIHRWLSYITQLALVGTVITFIWWANGNYLAVQYTNMHDYAYYETIATQIKSVDGYTDDMPVVLIGTPGDDATNNMGGLMDETFNLGGRSASNVDAYSCFEIMPKFLGYNPQWIGLSEDEQEYWSDIPEVANMPNYPDAGAIKVIGDSVVIKFR